MRHSPSSILSPTTSASFTTSLSRRLRTSISLKSAAAAASAAGGGVLASPMFGAIGRKRSGSRHNNNPEPSSPKVTCIGQVRVKTRRHVKKKMRGRSRKKSETSFRRSGEHNDGGGGCRFNASENRWVHLPVTICESLRVFSSNCFFPCRSSCTDKHRRDRNRRQAENNRCGGCGNSCSEVFTRWFVAEEETGGKRGEIEFVVGGEDDAVDERRRSRRRHVFEGLVFSDIDTKTERKENEAGSIETCAPPQNALLLMRCRSDPVKVAALTNKVRETQMSLHDETEMEEKNNGVEEDEEIREINELEMEDKKRIEICENWISGKIVPESEISKMISSVSRGKKEEVKVLNDSCEKEMKTTFVGSIEDGIRNTVKDEEHAAVTAMEEVKEGIEEESKDVASVTRDEERPGPGDPDNPEPDRNQVTEEKADNERTSCKVMPDCLRLMMMCEPKLSMEVSRETWVCSTDFMKWLPERPPQKKIDAGKLQSKNKTGTTAVESSASSRWRSSDNPMIDQVPLQPPRTSCSYPAAPPVIVAAAEQVTGANKAYEPPVLPRCNSEPRRSASKLEPEACNWKNRKLEPHPPATLGGGAAGVGV